MSFSQQLLEMFPFVYHSFCANHTSLIKNVRKWHTLHKVDLVRQIPVRSQYGYSSTLFDSVYLICLAIRSANDKYGYIWLLFLKTIESIDCVLASTTSRGYKCQYPPSTIGVLQLRSNSIKITCDKIWCRCAKRKAVICKCLRDTWHR